MTALPDRPIAGHCDLCDEDVPRSNPEAPADAHDLLDHLRLMHPQEYGEGPLHWPDGQRVVIDQDDLDFPPGW